MEDSENMAVSSETEGMNEQCVEADSEPGGGAETTEGGANEDNTENQENTGDGANESEACEREGGANEDNTENQENTGDGANESEACAREGGVTEHANTMEEEENKETDITQHKAGEQKKDTEVNKNKESEAEEEGKESNNDPHKKDNDSCDKEGQLEEKHKEEEKTKESEGKTKTKEDERDKKEKKGTKDDVKIKLENLERKSTKSSICPRSARPSTRRDAMAKFQKDQTQGVRNFKVQRTSIGMAGGASIKQKILNWCRNKTQKYEGVCIENFSSSWSDGLAFCALVHRFFPSAFDFSSLKASEREKNFSLAFSTAESLADCCPLLEVSDMLLMGNRPDPLCVFTYVQALCHHLSKIEKERREKETEKDTNTEEDRGVSDANGKGDGERDESGQNEETEENASYSGMKTEQETDPNANVINVVDEKLNELMNE